MKRTVIILAIVGYLKAAIFYWRWGAVHELLKEFVFVCPLCPHIDSVGSDWEKFRGRTLAFGTINAAVIVGGFLIGYRIYRFVRKWSPSN